MRGGWTRYAADAADVRPGAPGSAVPRPDMNIAWGRSGGPRVVPYPGRDGAGPARRDDRANCTALCPGRNAERRFRPFPGLLLRTRDTLQDDNFPFACGFAPRADVFAASFPFPVLLHPPCDIPPPMPIDLPDDLMVSVSGFRGRVGRTLTPELVTGLAASYGAFLREGGDVGPVIVGRDSRTSGPMLMRGAVAGLLSVGCPVVELGVVPTPTLMLAVRDSGAAGGIAVTASHNRAEWNALKFAVRGGTFLPPERMMLFRKRLTEADPERAEWDAIPEVSRDERSVERHIRRILELPFLDAEAIRRARIRVALDSVNGAGGVLIPRLLELLGCEVRAIGAEPHGRFHRDPEPTAANLAALGVLVKRCGARIGLAVDPDADRLSLVDERGRALGEDLTLALATDVVLRRERGPVVTNLSTSRVVEDVAHRHGCPVGRSPVGEINVVARMIEEGAVVGGEGNGGVIVPALQHTRDAPAGVALLLQYLADAPDVPLSERVRELPRYEIVKAKVGFPREALAPAYAALGEAAPGAELDEADGLRIEWPEQRRWLHVRPSGTEPVVRLIAEAPGGESARSLVELARRVLADTAGT